MTGKEDVFLERLKIRIRTSVSINEKDLDVVASEFTCRKILKNDFLLKEGGRCDFWGFIMEGLLRVYVHTDTGEEYSNGFVKEDSFITDSVSFFTQSVSLENIQALEDTQLMVLNFETLQALYQRFPAFDKFARILYEQRIVGIKTRIHYRVQLDAQSRYLHFLKSQPELIKRVPLKYIASYLNITDSTLSRIRRKTLHLQP
jgi:CRP-like cAMP-binding protein